VNAQPDSGTEMTVELLGGDGVVLIVRARASLDAEHDRATEDVQRWA
jgi:hypothetical protein